MDADSFSVRFTPRRPGSLWSRVNLKRAGELKAAGRMRRAGLDALAKRSASRYSFETRLVALAPNYLERLQADEDAWSHWQAQPPWYRRTCSFWIMSAKQEPTRERRLQQLIACSARGVAIGPLARARTG